VHLTPAGADQVNEMGDRLLVLDYPHFGEVEAWAVDDNRRITSLGKRGLRHGFGKQQWDRSRIIYDLSSLDEVSQTYYLRLLSESVMSIGVRLVQPEMFSAEVALHRFVLGLFYGILLAMGLYNLFIFAVARERVYLFYFFFLLCFGIYQFQFDGLTYVWLADLTSNYIAQQKVSIWLGILGYVWGVLFIRDYLVLREKAPRLDRIYQALGVIMATGALVGLFGGTWLVNMLANILGALLMIAMIIGGIDLLRKNFGPSRLFVMATVVFSLAVGIRILRNMGVLPDNVVTLYATHFGGVIQMVLLSLGLGQRINYLREEKEQALNEARNSMAANLHDELGSTLTAIGHFAGIIVDDDKISKSEQAQRFLPLIKESASDAQERVKDLIWSILPGEDEWAHFLANMKQYAANVFESMNIQYTIDIPDDISLRPMAMERRYHFWLIFKELLANLVKHSQCQNALVRVQELSREVDLLVEDDGVGIAPDMQNDGRGLDSIKSRLEELNAHYELDTAPNQGTRWNIRVKP
jgi:signal transduction histidine kinase